MRSDLRISILKSKIYLVNFTDGNTLKVTGFSDREGKAEHDCLVV